MDWSRKEIAQAFDASLATVNEWCKVGDFPNSRRDMADGRRYVYTASAVVQWFVRREITRIVGQSNASQDGGAAPADLLNLQQERARLARAQAEHKELDLAEKRGELVGAGAAVQALSHAISAARHILLQVHAQCAQTHPELPAEVVEQIRQQHHDALQALSESPMPGSVESEESAA